MCTNDIGQAWIEGLSDRGAPYPCGVCVCVSAWIHNAECCRKVWGRKFGSWWSNREPGCVRWQFGSDEIRGIKGPGPGKILRPRRCAAKLVVGTTVTAGQIAGFRAEFAAGVQLWRRPELGSSCRNPGSISRPESGRKIEPRFRPPITIYYISPESGLVFVTGFRAQNRARIPATLSAGFRARRPPNPVHVPRGWGVLAMALLPRFFRRHVAPWPTSLVFCSRCARHVCTRALALRPSPAQPKRRQWEQRA